MNNFWDERYSHKNYAFGTEPNLFFAEQMAKIKPGRILLPAEGEGRNAVFAARLGWDVVAFDNSAVGREKALSLAEKEKVSIEYLTYSFDDFVSEANSFDSIALIFAHLPGNKRQEHHRKLLQFLKPGGKIILEAFSKEQINNNTGGPRNIDFLFSKGELENDFSSLKGRRIEAFEMHLSEGEYHLGVSSLLRLTGEK